MKDESILSELFSALEIVVMERLYDDHLRIIGIVPDWFIKFY